MDPIDYSDAKLKFMGVRKHFFRDVAYHVTVFDDLIVMGIVFFPINIRHPIVDLLSTKYD